MLLAVAPTNMETEKLRYIYAKEACFVFCATYQNFINSAKEYRPTAILLKLDKVTKMLIDKMAKVREILPEVALITMSDSDTSALSPDKTISPRAHADTLRFQAFFYRDRSHNSSLIKENLIVHGVFLTLYDRSVFLYGRRADYSVEEIYLLRYLAEIHPRRAAAEELGRHCFIYGKKTPRSSISSRISRINKKALRVISAPIIDCRRGEGYGFI